MVAAAGDGATQSSDTTTQKLSNLREKYSKKKKSDTKTPRSRKTSKFKAPKLGAIFTPGSTVCIILCFLLIVLIGWLLFQGAHIYAELGRKVGESQVIDWKRMGAGIVEDWKYGSFLRDLLAFFLDIAASVLHALVITTYGFGFIIIFLLLQSGEIAPTVIKHSPRLRKSIISSFRKFKKINPQQGDSSLVTSMIEDYNRYYESFIFGLRVVQFACFCIDGGVVLYAAPPLKGGWSVWATGIDWTNVMRGSITLFFLWLAVWCFCLVRKGVRLFKGDVN
ncbi:hypothetical protein [Leptolyngbya sp. Heron Island J]|uniref:hypothetical protein n=1 Tax=Leptolyngbya sp. Heron Island J TaxID=1385935 RepID=UPI00040BA1B0|nr:hypothetical protein [Leptolyngbya sp. Heron Island J]